MVQVVQKSGYNIYSPSNHSTTF